MIPEEASLSLNSVWIDAEGGCPELEIGNYFCNFGIDYGLCTSGSGHALSGPNVTPAPSSSS